MAPKVGLEPTTDRLTADCSTIELLWMPNQRDAQSSNRICERQQILTQQHSRSRDQHRKKPLKVKLPTKLFLLEPPAECKFLLNGTAYCLAWSAVTAGDWEFRSSATSA